MGTSDSGMVPVPGGKIGRRISLGKRVQLRKHLHSLREIRGIMTAMKNLSLMEIKRLAQYISTQKRAVASLEEAVSDFLSYYSAQDFFAKEKPKVVPCLLLGSERGFCGGFNEALEQHLATAFKEEETPQPVLILVGKKLTTKFAGDTRVGATLPGPTTASEIQRVIIRLVKQLTEMGKARPSLRLRHLTVLYNEDNPHGFVTKIRRPFARFFEEEPQRFPFPPELNLPSQKFFEQLTDHYLFSSLHEIFYSSLMAEHRQRLQHMEGANQYLEKEIEHLGLRLNQLRQEEITEEIEVILLGSAVVSQTP